MGFDPRPASHQAFSVNDEEPSVCISCNQALFFGPPASRRPQPPSRPDPQGTMLTDYIRGIFNQNRQPSKIRGSSSDQSWSSTTSQVLARDALPGARRATSRQVLGTRTSSTEGRARPRTSTQGRAKPRWTPIYTK